MANDFLNWAFVERLCLRAYAGVELTNNELDLLQIAHDQFPNESETNIFNWIRYSTVDELISMIRDILVKQVQNS